jgi:Ras of Complex, Roc, domain of DAPkinase
VIELSGMVEWGVWFVCGILTRVIPHVGCAISAIPASLALPPALFELFLHGNPLKFPPSRLFASEQENVQILRVFLRHWQRGEPCHLECCRLLFVGFGGIGKSTLFDALRIKEPSQENCVAMFTSDRPSTHGIDASVWRPDGGATGLEHFRFNVCDFAGQMQYYEMHQHFLAEERAVYVLPFPLWTEEPDETHREHVEAQLTYWLSFIRSKMDAPASEPRCRPAVVLVGTFGDRVPNSSMVSPFHLPKVETLREAFSEWFYVCRDISVVDYKRPRALVPLRNRLVELGVYQIRCGSKCPQEYAEIASSLDLLRRQVQWLVPLPPFDRNWYASMCSSSCSFVLCSVCVRLFLTWRTLLRCRSAEEFYTHYVSKLECAEHLDHTYLTPERFLDLPEDRLRVGEVVVVASALCRTCVQSVNQPLADLFSSSSSPTSSPTVELCYDRPPRHCRGHLIRRA